MGPPVPNPFLMTTPASPAADPASAFPPPSHPRLVVPRRFADQRGWFSETWNAARLAGQGLDVAFVQDNQSWSARRGTIRGLHFQAPPHAQGKLVRAVRGRILDVAVDIRRGSPTYGRFVAVELTAAGGEQLWVPVGYAHGFCTLEDDCEVAYKVTDVYAPACEGGLAFDDPALAIPWPVAPCEASLSDKDTKYGGIAGFESPFAYDGVPLRPERVAP